MSQNLLSLNNIEVIAAALAFRGFWYFTSLVVGFLITTESYNLYSQSILEMQVGGILLAGGFYQVVGIEAARSADNSRAQRLYATCIALVLILLAVAFPFSTCINSIFMSHSKPDFHIPWWTLGLPYSVLLTMQGYYARTNTFRPLVVCNSIAVLIALGLQFIPTIQNDSTEAVIYLFLALSISALALLVHAQLLKIKLSFDEIYKLFHWIKLRSVIVLINNIVLPLSLLSCAYILTSNGNSQQVGILNFSYSIFALTLFAPNALSSKDISQSIGTTFINQGDLFKYLMEKVLRNLIILAISLTLIAAIACFTYWLFNSEVILKSWTTTITFFLVSVIFCIQLPVTTFLYQRGRDLELLIASIAWFCFVVGLAWIINLEFAQQLGFIYSAGYFLYFFIVFYLVSKE